MLLLPVSLILFGIVSCTGQEVVKQVDMKVAAPQPRWESTVRYALKAAVCSLHTRNVVHTHVEIHRAFMRASRGGNLKKIDVGPIAGDGSTSVKLTVSNLSESVDSILSQGKNGLLNGATIQPAADPTTVPGTTVAGGVTPVAPTVAPTTVAG